MLLNKNFIENKTLAPCLERRVGQGGGIMGKEPQCHSGRDDTSEQPKQEAKRQGGVSQSWYQTAEGTREGWVIEGGGKNRRNREEAITLRGRGGGINAISRKKPGLGMVYNGQSRLKQRKKGGGDVKKRRSTEKGGGHSTGGGRPISF